jgi:hypothetical protein
MAVWVHGLEPATDFLFSRVMLRGRSRKTAGLGVIPTVSTAHGQQHCAMPMPGGCCAVGRASAARGGGTLLHHIVCSVCHSFGIDVRCKYPPGLHAGSLDQRTSSFATI